MIARVISTAVGIWLMFAPAVLDYTGPPADSARIVGPVVASLSIIAISQPLRPVRWGVLPLALWLLAAPFVLGAPMAAAVSDVASGLVLVALAPVRGRVDVEIGGGWSAILRGGRPPHQETG